jgi:hypothetical protein
MAMSGASPSPWIAVTGPPGSGAEIVARALADLGLALVAPHGGVGPPGSADRLARVGDEVLALLGGTWWAPPERPEGWERRAEVSTAAPPMVATLEATIRAGGQAEVESVGVGSGPPPAVWPDQRHALLLPFWRDHHRGVAAVVIAWRRPGPTVVELGRQGFGDLHAIALWEAQLAAARATAVGLPVLGVDIDAAVEDPAGWAASAGRFMARIGWGPAPGAVARCARTLAASAGLLVVNKYDEPAAETQETHEAQRRTAGALAELVGPHLHWEPSPERPIGRWSSALLDTHLAAHRSAVAAAGAWATAGDVANDTASVAAALDWTVDRLVEGWASGRLTDGGLPTLPD